MKNHFFFVSLLIAFNLLSTHLKAQDSLQFIPKIEIGLIQGIGLGFEIPLSQKSVFEIGAGVGSGYTIFENEFENTWAIAQPAFYAQAKYKLYYNRQKRLNNVIPY